MNILKKYLRFLYLSCSGVVVSGCALAVIPLVKQDGTAEQKIFSTVVASVFWLGAALEILFFLLANRQCRVIEKVLSEQGQKNIGETKPGIFRFFTSPQATAADVMSVVSFLTAVLLIIFKVTNEWLFVSITVIFFFSFNLHCFLNGKNYTYYREIKKYNKKKQGAKKDE